jgi:hypothetical protein
MKKNGNGGGGLEVDEVRLTYYKTFLDHAKKFMMDFKVSNSEEVAGKKNMDTAKGPNGKPKLGPAR